MTVFLLTGKGKDQINSPRQNRNDIPNAEKRLMEKAMKLEFQREPSLINEETPFHVIKTYKLHSDIPRPSFSRDGQHLEMETSVQH